MSEQTETETTREPVYYGPCATCATVHGSYEKCPTLSTALANLMAASTAFATAWRLHAGEPMPNVIAELHEAARVFGNNEPPAGPAPTREGEPFYKAIHEAQCEYRLVGSPHPCTCTPPMSEQDTQETQETMEARDTTTREHDLKVWPEFFDALLSGDKTFEARKDDRGFRVGDVLRLREWARNGNVSFGVHMGEYTGREMRRRVSYLLSGPAFGVERDYVIMALEASPTLAHGVTPGTTGPRDAVVRDADEGAPPAGGEDASEMEPGDCPSCEGTGEMHVPSSVPEDDGSVSCSTCGGSGRMPTPDEIAAMREGLWRATGDLHTAEYEIAQLRGHRGTPAPTGGAHAAEGGAIDAARWRFVRQFLSSDVMDPDATPLAEFVKFDGQALYEATSSVGADLSVEQLIDRARHVTPPTGERAGGAASVSDGVMLAQAMQHILDVANSTTASDTSIVSQVLRIARRSLDAARAARPAREGGA